MELSSITSEQYRKLETAELMRVLSAKACAQGGSPLEYYQARWGTSPTAPIVQRAFEWERRTLDEWMTKAAVAPGTTSDATWAQPLVTTRLMSGFVGLVKQASVVSKMPVLPVPFQTSLPHQVSGASMKWVGENSPKPATKLGLGKTALAPFKAGGIVVVSRELMTFAVPGSEQALQQILLNELVTFTDSALLSAAAATASSPAGILNGVTVSASIAAAISAFFTARPNAIAPTWITSPANIGTLSALDPMNVPARFKGYPLVVSPSAGANLILLDPPVLAVADDGLELDVTDQALIEMNDAAAPATAATLYVSLWQENLVGIRVERFVNWKAAAGSVQFTATLT
jgi:hypothetical protein